MIPLDDEFISEESRQTALDLKANTSKLLRAFMQEENQLKIKAYEHKSADFIQFLDTFYKLQTLMDSKLNTPLEEVNSIKDTLKHLQAKTETLRDLCGTKKDAYLKYCEECSKSKELRKV